MMHAMCGYPEDISITKAISPMYQEAYENGFVRIVTDSNEVLFEGLEEDLRAHLPKLIRLVKESDPDAVYVTVVARDWGIKAEDTFAWPERSGDLIRFIKTGEKVASPYKA